MKKSASTKKKKNTSSIAKLVLSGELAVFAPEMEQQRQLERIFLDHGYRWSSSFSQHPDGTRVNLSSDNGSWAYMMIVSYSNLDPKHITRLTPEAGFIKRGEYVLYEEFMTQHQKLTKKKSYLIKAGMAPIYKGTYVDIIF